MPPTLFTTIKKPLLNKNPAALYNKLACTKHLHDLYLFYTLQPLKRSASPYISIGAVLLSSWSTQIVDIRVV